MVLIEIFGVVAVVAYCLYKWYCANFDHFAKKNIPFIKPISPFKFLKEILFRKEPLLDELVRLHNEYKHTPFYGSFEMRNPVIFVHDPDLIKQITVKDFEHFMNHRSFAEPEDDPLFSNSIFAMKNDKWKDMRSTLSPAFTGSKMRMMFELINETCSQAVKYLKDLSKDKPEGIDMEMKDFFTLYTNDVIASTAFGINVNSLADKNNEFYLNCKKATVFSNFQILKMILYGMTKNLCKLLNIKVFDSVFASYFYRLVLDAMKYRTENNIIRPDMINMLMEAKSSPDKSHNREWTDTEIVAQCFIFLFAGFESTATSLCFAAHEIMENPEVQEKLLAEIDNIKENLNGKPLTYESLQNMKYMDMVISESLRKWPSVQAIDRVCTKDYTIRTDNVEYEVKCGDLVFISVAGLHFDEEYFPNPKKFDPERFSDENKGSIKPFTYVPFGFGPRICIGSRLALMEAKAVLYYMLSNFTLEAGEKTNIPLKLSNEAFPLKSINGFWMKLVPRK